MNQKFQRFDNSFLREYRYDTLPQPVLLNGNRRYRVLSRFPVDLNGQQHNLYKVTDKTFWLDNDESFLIKSSASKTSREFVSIIGDSIADAPILGFTSEDVSPFTEVGWTGGQTSRSLPLNQIIQYPQGLLSTVIIDMISIVRTDQATPRVISGDIRQLTFFDSNSVSLFELVNPTNAQQGAFKSGFYWQAQTNEQGLIVPLNGIVTFTGSSVAGDTLAGIVIGYRFQ